MRLIALSMRPNPFSMRPFLLSMRLNANSMRLLHILAKNPNKKSAKGHALAPFIEIVHKNKRTTWGLPPP